MATGALPPAAVVGLEVNGLGVARALHQCGIRSIGFAAPFWSPATSTRTARVVPVPEWTAEGLVDVMMRVGRTLPAKAPVLITKDEPVLWISEHREKLSQFYEIVLPNPKTVETLMDKTRFQDMAITHGWPTPQAWRVNTLAALKDIQHQVIFPSILKPAIKNSVFRLKSPKKAFKVDDVQQLIDCYNMVAQWEEDVIIQEWIPGGDDRIAFCLGYWNRTSEPAGLFAGRKIRQWPPECGNTSSAEPAPAAWQDSLRSVSQTIFQFFGFQGLGSIEYKMRPDGSPVIMEPTVGRTNYQNEVAVINGVNLPAIAYYDMLGNTGERDRLMALARQPHPLTKLVDEVADPRSAQHYIAAGTLTQSEWQASIAGPKRFMLFRPDDPAPYLVSTARSTATQLKGWLRKRLRG